MSPSGDNQPTVAAETLAAQVQAIFEAWGLASPQIEPTVRLMVEADRRGIDSHGVATLPLYDEFRRSGKLTLTPEITVVRQSPVTALIDGGGGLGHFPSWQAMNLAIEKCSTTGVGTVAVRNSNHYGAAGVYALMAARKGYIGVSTTAVWRPGVVPTFGAEPMLGTNPIAFAAPAKRHPPFCLDMATSTVAIGKIKLAALQGKPIPPGWASDDHGGSVTDAGEAMRHVCLTPLGGFPQMSSHKGYGLGAMVEILSTILPGALYAATRLADPDAARYNVGHFFLALDPASFREPGEFEADLDALIDDLHATRRAHPEQPVLIRANSRSTKRPSAAATAFPFHAQLRQTIRRLAESSGAEVMITDLDGPDRSDWEPASG